MRCQKCRGDASVEIRRHHAAFCNEHFIEFFEHQVTRSIEGERMFTRDDRVLVVVSGGKDSLALWDVLRRLGYQTTGLYINLGIGEYSQESQRKAEAYAAGQGADLLIADIPHDYGMSVEDFARATGRVSCSACGLSKRYLFNRVAMDRGFPVVATGHNLDDEAAVLLGNLLHWQTEYLGRQAPVLQSTHPQFAKKVKPLYRIAERETAAYAVIRGIDYIVEECPNSVGAKSLLYKDALNLLEQAAPGTKQSLYWGFLERGRPLVEALGSPALRACVHCGQPTTAEVCAFCRMTERAAERMRVRLASAASATGPAPDLAAERPAAADQPDASAPLAEAG
ncbi:MAG TPA: ATP-binding protein, partial [bacterium]|nr:ATP-binding protein [bacterium]